MRDWKVILVGGAALLILGCSRSATEPARVVQKSSTVKASDDGDYCDARTGYFVRAGRQTEDPCTP